MSGFWSILSRDVKLGLRQASDGAQVLVFFVLAATLFPFGVGPEANLLARIASGVVWVTALLAAMLSLDRLFSADFEDGTLDQMALSDTPLAILVLAKVAAHWLLTGLPLLLAAPVLAIMLNIDAELLPVLIASMALGTPCLSLFGAIGAALTLGARRSGTLVPLLVLPLVLPVLIFGVGAIEASATGLGARPYLLILAALLAGAAGLAPIAAAEGLKLAVRSGN